MTIDLTKIAISSQTPGMQNTATKTFNYSVPSQTLTTVNQQYNTTNTFTINAGFQFVYGQFQMPGLDSTWRVLNGGTSYYNFNSSNQWVVTGSNAYSVRLFTSLSSGSVTQTLRLQYQNSPNPITIPAFTVNLKFFILKAPF